ncbi:MAG: asparagine synthase (glutamine-hydrolyzing) [Acidobacteria bacterium 13_1_40CM_65_14]|nr:MAG: asparagine synthase (glutamine-hydrolyzing) [Acidobacteria bacterium 13_1_40CM_65_14]
MCGIAGELRFDGAAVPEARLVAMRDQLVHRGPDSTGTYLARGDRMGLGFRRLRIIDLTPNAGQPMTNEDGSVQLVFNGEIYNFLDLRKGLIARGHRFRSRSDTETIVHLYEEKGADCIADLDGMFAIAIWDERSRRLLLARDRAGKKPLFYCRSDRFLAFASEIKSFFALPDMVMEPDPESVPYYFIHGYVPGPATFYKHVRQLEPGTLTIVDADGRMATRRYWQIEFPRAADVKPIPAHEAAAGVRERMARAVERRLISDVPLGAFLSGGIDSTIVVGLMSRVMAAPVKTFSIGFEGDPAYDETAYARLAAERFKTEHTEFRVLPASGDLIDTLIWHHDGPFGDSSAVPTYLVSKLARAHVTVVLTGDGGDELFAGYRRFWAAVQAERVPRIAARAGEALLSRLAARRHERHWLTDAQRFLRAARATFEERMTLLNALFFEDLRDLLRPEFAATLGPIDRLRYLAGERARMEGRSALSRLLHVNFTSYLADDLLVKVDRCTMASSLEARSPFLDRELIEYVAALPDRFKLDGMRAKAILREAFADLVPAAIDRRTKMGFGVPLGAWFRGSLRDYLRDLLLAPEARYREMLSGPFVEDLVRRHLAGRANVAPQLWSVMCFERWLQMLPDWRRGSGARELRASLAY